MPGPSADVTIREGTSGTKTMTFMVTLSPPAAPAHQGAERRDKAVPTRRRRRITGKASARARGGAMSGAQRLLATVMPMLAAVLLSGMAVAQDVVEYYQLDSVGNVLVVTNAQGAVLEEHDYLPFGEELCEGNVPCATPKPGQPRRFTGKERDAETGLDYFGARYYQAKLARFTTVDPKLNVKFESPGPAAVESLLIRPQQSASVHRS
jgi:RHS repeat-associated protein